MYWKIKSNLPFKTDILTSKTLIFQFMLEKIKETATFIKKRVGDTPKISIILGT